MDTMTVDERSERMRRVRSKGNRSTEWKLRAVLVGRGVTGWRMHAEDLPGCPDFVFPTRKLVVFVDGCFWHDCPICKRPLPSSNRKYWKEKIAKNVSRAGDVNADLERLGYRVVRIWEHELRTVLARRQAIDALLDN